MKHNYIDDANRWILEKYGISEADIVCVTEKFQFQSGAVKKKHLKTQKPTLFCGIAWLKSCKKNWTKCINPLSIKLKSGIPANRQKFQGTPQFTNRPKKVN